MEKFHSTVLLPWPYDHEVTAAVWEIGSLYVGTSSGYIYRFNSSDLKVFKKIYTENYSGNS